MQYRIQQMEGGTPEPSLADMTEKAIRILSRGKNGYFLLVEGE
jgi:alkaline phosphatase